MTYPVQVHRYAQAGVNLCQDADGNWEVRYPLEHVYLAPKASGPTIEAAIAAHMAGQRLCVTVGCDLPFGHTALLSPTSGEHHAVGPATRADWQRRRLSWIQGQRVGGNVQPALSARSGDATNWLTTNPLKGRSLQNT